MYFKLGAGYRVRAIEVCLVPRWIKLITNVSPTHIVLIEKTILS